MFVFTRKKINTNLTKCYTNFAALRSLVGQQITPHIYLKKKLLIVLKSIEYYLVKKFISYLCMKIFSYISICGAVLFKEINIHM